MNNINRFIKLTVQDMPNEVKKQWLDQWNKRDYLSLIQTMEIMTNMSDEQRNKIEDFAQNLIKC